MRKTLLSLMAFSTLAFANSGTMYKSPYCGCCDKWSEHMQKAGFELKTIKTNDMYDIKNDLKIPLELSSCHTAVIDGYSFEGHIPSVDIKEFLTLKPADAFGLVVPGMPLGSPGMEQGGVDDYDVLILKKDGSTEVFTSYIEGKRFKI